MHIIDKSLNEIRVKSPLILNITNDVSINFVANGLLSLGASPIMSKAIEEIAELVQISEAVVVNIGTLNEEFIQLAKYACKMANHYNKPLVLDPVGAGATLYRTNTSLDLLNNYKFNILRGNASEIMALVNENVTSKGVDSAHHTHEAIDAGLQLARHYSLVVAVSGEIDNVISSEVKKVSRGHSLMTKITGTGCLLTSVMAAFIAVGDNDANASGQAFEFYGACGERALANQYYPGSFQINFLNELSKTYEQ